MKKELDKDQLVKIVVIEIALFVLAILAFDGLGKKGYGKERTAENYFVKYMNADLAGIYDEFDLEESAFVNKETFVNGFQGMQPQDYTEYEVETNETGTLEKLKNNFVGIIAKLFHSAPDITASGSQQVSIDYTDTTGGKNQMAVRLTEQQGRKFFYFKTWKVDASDFMVQDYTIRIPNGASATLNGTELTEEYRSTDGVYVIPQIFKGVYELRVTKEDMEDSTIQVNTADGGYYVEKMQLQSEAAQNAIQQAAGDMEKIYTAAFQDKNYLDLGLTVRPENKEYIQTDYEELRSDVQENNRRKLQVGEIKPYVFYETDEDGNFYITVQLSYDYYVTYEYESWDEIYQDEYDGSNDAEFKYLKDGSGLQLCEMGGLYL